MSGFEDYIKWRGDLSFRAVPFCAIDALILCQLCYARLEGLVPKRSEMRTVRGRDLPAKFDALADAKDRRYLGALINGERTMNLFSLAFNSVRFAELEVFAYENVTEEENTKQFSALSFLLPDKTVFCAFRGTDDTIVGWKEDFAMAFLPVIPAQKAAAEYVSAVYAKSAGRGRRIRLGGHSKGGNLAVYACACCSAKARRKILAAYSFDGPGFAKERLETPEFRAAESRVISFTPEVSIVGMLFDHMGQFNIVASTEKGVRQHDAFSWKIDGPNFVLLDDVSSFSKFFDRRLKKYLEENDGEKREALVSSIFDIIQASKARTLTDLKKGGFESSFAILSAALKNGLFPRKS